MTSIKVKFRPSSKEGKKGIIYYQLIHNRVVRQVHSRHKLYPEDWDKSTNSIITNNPERKEEIELLNKEVALDLKRLDATLRIINLQKVDYSADEVTELFSKIKDKLTLFDYINDKSKELRQNGKTRTAETYTAALYSIRRFLVNDILLEELTPQIINEYEQCLLDKGLTKNSSSFYLRILRSCYNKAVDEGIIEQAFPFRDVYTGIAKTLRAALNEEQIDVMRKMTLTRQPKQSFARDMFMLSYYMRGTDLIDIALLKEENFVGDAIVFNRYKNNKPMVVKMEPRIERIIKRYRSRRKSPYKLPLLKPPFTNNRLIYKNLLIRINKHLKYVGEKIGLDFPLSMNVALHTWAYLAVKNNMDFASIHELSGQHFEKETRCYLKTLYNTEAEKAEVLRNAEE